MVSRTFSVFSSAHSKSRFQNQVALFQAQRWGDVYTCPECGGGNVSVCMQGMYWCQNCSKGFCCRCRRAHKPSSISCEAYTEWLIREKEHHNSFGVWAQMAGALLCPKCHVIIEKNGGCNNMYCTACKSPFQWTSAQKVGSGGWFKFFTDATRPKVPGFNAHGKRRRRRAAARRKGLLNSLKEKEKIDVRSSEDFTAVRHA